jgi:hypothetical protein
LLQGFGVNRFPSATDVFDNTLGALLGSLLPLRLFRLKKLITI